MSKRTYETIVDNDYIEELWRLKKILRDCCDLIGLKREDYRDLPKKIKELKGKSK
jgi:DUF1365 family protein